MKNKLMECSAQQQLWPIRFVQFVYVYGWSFLVRFLCVFACDESPNKAENYNYYFSFIENVWKCVQCKRLKHITAKNRPMHTTNLALYENEKWKLPSYEPSQVISIFFLSFFFSCSLTSCTLTHTHSISVFFFFF